MSSLNQCMIPPSAMTPTEGSEAILMKFMKFMRNGRKCRCHKGSRRFLANGDFSNRERRGEARKAGRIAEKPCAIGIGGFPTGGEAVGNPGRSVPYAMGSGSPGGSGISKTLSVMETSM